MNITDICITGTLFALEPIKNPRAYLKGTFVDDTKVRILRLDGRALSFRIEGFFDQDNMDFTELISSLTYGAPTNIVYNVEFSTQSDTPDTVPQFDMCVA